MTRCEGIREKNIGDFVVSTSSISYPLRCCYSMDSPIDAEPEQCTPPSSQSCWEDELMTISTFGQRSMVGYQYSTG